MNRIGIFLLAFLLINPLSIFVLNVSAKRTVQEYEYSNLFNEDGSTELAISIQVDKASRVRILNIPEEVKFVRLGDSKKKKVKKKDRRVQFKLRGDSSITNKFILLEGYSKKRSSSPILTAYGKISSFESVNSCGLDLSEAEQAAKICGDIVYSGNQLTEHTITKQFNNQCELDKFNATLSASNECDNEVSGNGGIAGSVFCSSISKKVTIPGRWPSVRARNSGPNQVSIGGWVLNPSSFFGPNITNGAKVDCFTTNGGTATVIFQQN